MQGIPATQPQTQPSVQAQTTNLTPQPITTVIPNQTPPISINEIPPTDLTPNKKIFLIAGIIVLFLALVAGGIFAYGQYSSPQTISLDDSHMATAIPSLNVLNNDSEKQSDVETKQVTDTGNDEMGEWEPYKNDKFSFKYPSIYKIEENVATNGDYIQIIFDKDKLNNFNITATTEYTPQNVVYLLNQESDGSMDIGDYQWSIYRSSTGYGDAGGYSAPYFGLQIEVKDVLYTAIFYNEDTISSVQKQILSTFEFAGGNNDQVVNWKTYSNKTLGYTINYPIDWLIDTTEAELPINAENSQKLIIYKGEYKITILWPSAFGPGVCLFDDDSKVGASEMTSYCEGEYVEFTSNNNQNKHRRLLKPETLVDYQRWQVYTKEKTYFVTVPPISFVAPLDYKVSQIEMMDQILSTFKSIN